MKTFLKNMSCAFALSCFVVTAYAGDALFECQVAGLLDGGKHYTVSPDLKLTVKTVGWGGGQTVAENLPLLPKAGVYVEEKRISFPSEEPSVSRSEQSLLRLTAEGGKYEILATLTRKPDFLECDPESDCPATKKVFFDAKLTVGADPLPGKEGELLSELYCMAATEEAFAQLGLLGK